jgi:hypothetical protein
MAVKAAFGRVGVHMKENVRGISRQRCARIVLVVGIFVAAGAAHAQTGLNDTQVSGAGVLDPEFDPYSNRYTYCRQTAQQSSGTLWVGTFNSDGTLNTDEEQQLDKCVFQGNGPEWGRDASGAVISYVKLDGPGKPSLYYAHEDAPGSFSIHGVPNLPALSATKNAVYPSDDASDKNARVLFLAAKDSSSKDLVVDWRSLGPGGAGGTVSTDDGFWRWGSQSNFIAVAKATGASQVQQIWVLNTSTGNSVQVTRDDGNKSTPHMWFDATWGWVVSGVVDNNCQVYQYPSGNKKVIIPSPNGTAMQSLEHFVYQGHSYVYYYVSNNLPDGTTNNDVYVSSVEENYKHLKVSGDEARNRYEPEVAFPAGGGTPIIFFSARGASGGGNAVWRPAIVDLP